MKISRFTKYCVATCLNLVSFCLIAGPLGSLDTSSRKAVREAEMTGYGSTGTEASSGALNQLDTSSRKLVRESDMKKYGTNNIGGAATPQDVANPGVLIQNTIDAHGHKKCIVSVGKLVNGEVRWGSTVENRTIVMGNIVNVCQD